MTDDQIKHELAIGFEYCYQHDDWVEPVEQALAGLTAEQALWRPNPEVKGIWDMVLHLAAWNENIVERTETGQKAHPAEGAWPPPPETPSEEAWAAAKQRLMKSYESVQQLIANSPLDKLQSAPYGIGDLLCRFTHSGYHLGQISKIRELKGM